MRKNKIAVVMEEFYAGELFSHGKKVKNRKQALAIGYSEERKHG